MKDIIVLLPFSPFSEEDLDKAIIAIYKEFRVNNIILCCHKLSYDYYKKNLPEKKIKILIDNNDKFNSLELSMISIVYKYEKDFEKYIFLILNNLNHEIAISTKTDLPINIYRWYILDNRIWNISEEILLIEDKYIENNIFSRMQRKHKGTFGLLPYGFNVRLPGYGNINELGFRLQIDYQKLKQRDENHKLICFTGGSSCYSMCCRSDEMFTSRLEILLNEKSKKNGSKIKYTVLNFGMMGYLVLNEMITYLLYIDELNPDLVVSYSLLNDLQCGMSNDKTLLSKFKINYNHRYEEWAKILTKSKEELAWSDEGMYNNENIPKDIIMTYHERLMQFKKYVNSNESSFLSVIQPMFFSKKELSEREEIGYNYYTALGVKKEYMFIENMYNKYITYLKKQNLYDEVLDLHNEFNQYNKDFSLFVDSAHTTSWGDEIIANHLFERLNNLKM